MASDDFLQSGVSDVRSGWQRCLNNTAPHSDCTSIPLRWQLTYTPVAADISHYIRMVVYYETSAGVWTRRAPAFTGQVAAASQ